MGPRAGPAGRASIGRGARPTPLPRRSGAGAAALALALGVACERPPAWTEEGAVAPTLARLDRDADGRVGAAEFEAHAYAAPGFDEVDADGDGALSPSELLALVRSQDPLTFDRTSPRPAPGGIWGTGAVDPARQMLWELLAVLRDEAVARDTTAALPDSETYREIVRRGRMDDPEVRSALRALRAAWIDAGLEFPPRLEAEALLGPLGLARDRAP